jgi:hypothetical protein
MAERLKRASGRRWRTGRPEDGAGTAGGSANVTRRCRRTRAVEAGAGGCGRSGGRPRRWGTAGRAAAGSSAAFNPLFHGIWPIGLALFQSCP